MKTLYVSDLDGTLLTSRENVSEYSKDKLNALIGRGVSFTFATARSKSSAFRATEGLNVGLPVVLYNGGLVYDPVSQRAIYSVLFSQEEKRYVLSVLAGFDILPFVYGMHGNLEERLRWIGGRENTGMKRYLSRRSLDGRLLPAASEEELICDEVFYFKCVGAQEQLERAWNVLKFDSRFICIFHREVYQSDYWMEISPRAATKANGVLKLKELLGYERVVCFGDTSNDSDMFDVCDEHYAVMNADDWLKAKATGVVGFCEEDGVAKWLEAHAVVS